MRGNGPKVLAVVVLVTTALGMGAAIRAAGIHLRKTPIHPPGNRQLSSIPAETPSWSRFGADRIESPEIVETLGTENYVTRAYIRRGSPSGERPQIVEFHAAYYTGMIDTVPHVPERCFVGGGLQQSMSSRVVELDLAGETWVTDTSVSPDNAGRTGAIYTVRLPNDPAYTDAPGRRVRLPAGVGPDDPLRMRCSEFVLPDGQRMYSGYFFIANGGTVPNANDVRALAFNLKDDYAYYLKVQINTAAVGSVEELAEVASSIIDELLGEVMRCVPDWVEVEEGRYPPAAG